MKLESKHAKSWKGMLWLRETIDLYSISLSVKEYIEEKLDWDQKWDLKTRSFLESLPAHLIKEGLELACPPPAEVVSINKIKTSPVKNMVSIRGQVVTVSNLEFQYYFNFFNDVSFI